MFSHFIGDVQKMQNPKTLSPVSALLQNSSLPLHQTTGRGRSSRQTNWVTMQHEPDEKKLRNRLMSHRMLPMRLTTDANDYRKFGVASGVVCYRQRLSRMWLEGFVPCITGNLHDMRVEMSPETRPKSQILNAELAKTGKAGFFPDVGPRLGGPTPTMHDGDLAIWNKYLLGLPLFTWTPESQSSVQRLLDRGCRVIPLFVSMLSSGVMAHIIAIIVTFNQDASLVTRVLWLNTWNILGERANDVCMASVASALTNLVPQQSAEMIMQAMELPLSPGYNLQDGEKKGYCQSWDSYLIYHVLVLHENPGQLFQHLLRLAPRQRQQALLDFTNALVYNRTPTTLPVHVEFSI